MPESTLTPAPVSRVTFPDAKNDAMRSTATAGEDCAGETTWGIVGTESRIQEWFRSRSNSLAGPPLRRAAGTITRLFHERFARTSCWVADARLCPLLCGLVAIPQHAHRPCICSQLRSGRERPFAPCLTRPRTRRRKRGHDRQVVSTRSCRRYALPNEISYESQDALYDVAWSEIHENQIVTGSGDGSIKLWDVMLNVSLPCISFAWHSNSRVTKVSVGLSDSCLA